MAFWWIFLVAYGSMNFAKSHPCPPTLPEECNCTELIGSGLNITCQGYDIVNITQQLPPNTVAFQYVAMEMFVQLEAINFTHVPHLNTLMIKDPHDENVLSRKIYLMSGNDKIFQGLDKLQTFAINVNWEMTRLPGIFMGLPSLETLDLSNTRLMNIDNLIDSLQGLRNNTNLTVLNLWNIQTLEFSSTNLKFDLGKVLEPLSKSKLKKLNIGYNAFRYVKPGILQYAPELKKIIVRNNALSPILTSSLMSEVFLHSSLEEADFSEQGFRPMNDIPVLNTRQNFNALAELFNQTTLLGRMSGPQASIPIPPSVIEFLKRFVACFMLLYEDTCHIYHQACQPVKLQLSQDHDLFCALLKVFFQWQFSGIPCNYLPPFDALISRECGACLVIPSLGSLKSMKLAGMNVYDYTLLYQAYRGRPLCFHPNTSIEYFDVSSNEAHGFPCANDVFHTDIRGLEKLKFLNMSRSGLDILYEHLTFNYPNLKTLDASHNKLVLDDEQPINIAVSIEVLILSHNNIRHIPEDKFTLLKNLQKLDLSYNSIKDFKINLRSCLMLEYLDLRGNAIITLDPHTLDQLNAISLSNTSRTLQVYIANNNLICACSTRSFVAWVLHRHPPNILLEDVQHYMCANRYSDLVLFHKVSMFTIQFECIENIVYGCVGAVSMVVLLGLAWAYKRRFLLRHQVYKLNKRFRRRDGRQQSHEYDAFICFDGDDSDWIQHVLKPRLRAFNVQYNDEDIEFGRNVLEVVPQYIEASYRSVLVLSPSFINTPNNMYHTRMVQDNLVNSGNDNVIVIVLKPLNRVGLDRTLRELMEHRLCLEWKDDNVDAQNYFWERLIDALGAPCEEMYDTSYDENNRLLAG